MSSLQVDFYILESTAERETLRTACRVAEKAWSRLLALFEKELA